MDYYIVEIVAIEYQYRLEEKEIIELIHYAIITELI